MTEAPPARRTRPRNRRDLILAAAGELFADRGYDQVAMSDVAEAVGIGASALYRHVSSKQDLLAAVVDASLTPVEDLVTSQGVVLTALAGGSLDDRRFGLLWHREVRHLAPEDHARLRARMRAIGECVTADVRAARPDLGEPAADLLAWSMLAVVASPSYHRADLPRPAFDQLIADLAATVRSSEVPDVRRSRPAGQEPRVPATRREQLLTAAVRLFTEHGYARVGIEDVGKAVGIAGPSVYNHWPTKLDLLLTPVRRAAAVLAVDATTAYAEASDPADALRRLVRSYVGLTHAHHEVFGLLVTDLDHLPADTRHELRQTQRHYVDEWIHLLRLHHPDLDQATARIRVHAALSVVNDTARTPHLRNATGVRGAVEVLCARLLGLP
ncbi:TetR/AcrR family transcriptional regulator [Lentzea sp. NPDC059081]|uniref:TetR/AcrR family transcriptional regulator n=1 Tax=Lentzea sp. NPDC059081 TaxID=3346719 RepID=UPI0036C022CB